MDWDQVHSFAVEAELWSTLAINAWLMLTGAVFVWLLAQGNSAPKAVQILRAAAIALLLLCYSVSMLVLDWYWFGHKLTNEYLILDVIVVLISVVAIPAVVTRLRLLKMFRVLVKYFKRAAAKGIRQAKAESDKPGAKVKL